MPNPWKDIALSDYESHMSLDSVAQLQTLSAMIKQQLSLFPAESAMILGVAGGNGLGHINRAKYKTVYGVDVNSDYLDEVAKRYPGLEGTLKLICADLTSEYDRLPRADLVIADLLIEYIGVDCFAKVISRVSPKYISCGIQVDTGEGFVSDSPYLHAFDGLDSIHSRIDPDELSQALSSAGYTLSERIGYPLPNGKQLVRIDGTML